MLETCEFKNNKKNPLGLTGLQYSALACHTTSLPACILLLRVGADVTSTWHGYYALHLAAIVGATETCVFLIESGQNPNVIDVDGRSALRTTQHNTTHIHTHTHTQHTHTHNTHTHNKTHTQHTHTHIIDHACIAGNRELSMALLRHGVDKSILDRDARTAMSLWGTATPMPDTDYRIPCGPNANFDVLVSHTTLFQFFTQFPSLKYVPDNDNDAIKKGCNPAIRRSRALQEEALRVISMHLPQSSSSTNPFNVKTIPSTSPSHTAATAASATTATNAASSLLSLSSLSPSSPAAAVTLPSLLPPVPSERSRLANEYLLDGNEKNADERTARAAAAAAVALMFRCSWMSPLLKRFVVRRTELMYALMDMDVGFARHAVAVEEFERGTVGHYWVTYEHFVGFWLRR